jgi:excisionase family DNA binding protein
MSAQDDVQEVFFSKEDVLCAHQVAEVLGVDRKSVYNAVARGKLPHQRLGKRVLFSRHVLAQWLAGVPPVQEIAS